MTPDLTIPYRKLDFKLEAIDDISLPPYKGAALRGGFGSAFRRVVCALRRNDCDGCMLKAQCVYAYIFETAPPKNTGIMGAGSYARVPHPFIIEPPLEGERVFRPGETISFGLVLVGKAVEYLPYFIYAFEELGRSGLGKGRGKFRLSRAEECGAAVYSSDEKRLSCGAVRELRVMGQEPPQSPFNKGGGTSLPPVGTPSLLKRGPGGVPSTGGATLRFLTPLRIISDDSPAAELPFHLLIRTLLRRVGLLYHFHCGGSEPTWDHLALIEKSMDVSVAHNGLRWWDWERYSTRQHARIKMGGVVGEITYRGEMAPFMPLLAAGEVLHVGKGTSMGLGKYQLLEA